MESDLIIMEVDEMEIPEPKDYKDFVIRSYLNRIRDLEDKVYELEKTIEELNFQKFQNLDISDTKKRRIN